MRDRIANAFAALFGCITLAEHDLRVSELLSANNREVMRRREAELDRDLLTGHVMRLTRAIAERTGDGR